MTLPPHRVRLAGDYGAESPVWSSIDGRMIDLAELPVSADTRALLAAWAVRWQELAAGGVLVEGPVAQPAEWQRLEADAETLRGRLQAELGPRWTVTVAG
jgi:hypothetical protein